MKNIFLYIFVVIVLIFFVPYFVVSVKGIKNEKGIKQEENTISVYIKDEDIVLDIPMEEYIINVVCAEMPALFETEALKAQAVAARTYTVSKIKANKNEEILKAHKNAQICTDSTHCQAYMSKDEAYKKWGKDADSFYQKISDAVLLTKGEILTYQNEPIQAVFHSSNSGRTENAKDVWGRDFEYLVSVVSDGEDLSPRYENEYVTTYENFKNIILNEYPDIDESKFVDNITYTRGGAVDSINIFGKSIKGTKVRQMFKLSSANFEIKKENDIVTFKSYGYGHGVGMSQYGANFMASEGKNYKQILENYYNGTTILMYNPR
ncbi:MAG: stage II sporulation protein D [Ruminococcaceae bacterium]|nr:stage II sporulation protein D [Oscillospiraceae bacterium]